MDNHGNFRVMLQFLALVLVLAFGIYTYLTDPLRHIPGPFLYRISKWRLAIDDFRACRTRTIHFLHAKYAP